MRKLIERLALFFVGLPLIIASVFFLPQGNYAVLHAEILIVTVLAILEMRSILSQKMPVPSVFISVCVGMLVPVAAFLHSVFGVNFRIITSAIAISCVLILFIEFIFSFSGKFEKSIERIGSAFILVIYPGYFVMYLSIMTVWNDAGAILSLFFLMVFGCDSLAWFFGVLLGKNNRGIIPASPNKSIAGFFGGYIGSICPGVLAYFIVPDVFQGSLWKLVVLGFFTATAAIVGDIIESVFKRSAGVKDSGAIVPGRGGVLDSIDSILLAAPVYYILADFLFGF
jgi:phosphatidate cytidylyltransferase